MFRNITIAVLFVLLSTAVAYSGVRWCEHTDGDVSGHLVLENPGDSPFVDHSGSDTAEASQCPGCVHLPAIDIADHADVTSLSQILSPSLNSFSATNTFHEIHILHDFLQVSASQQGDNSLVPDPQLDTFKFISLLI